MPEANRDATDSAVPFLDDPERVRYIIQQFLAECLAKRCEPRATSSGIFNHDRDYCHRLADMFLGQRDDIATGHKGWNRPGAIDAQIAKYYNIQERSPTKRLATFFALKLIKVVRTIEDASKAELSPREWEGSIRTLVEKTTRELCNLPTRNEDGTPRLIQTYNTDEDDEAAYDRAKKAALRPPAPRALAPR